MSVNVKSLVSPMESCISAFSFLATGTTISPTTNVMTKIVEPTIMIEFLLYLAVKPDICITNNWFVLTKLERPKTEPIKTANGIQLIPK